MIGYLDDDLDCLQDCDEHNADFYVQILVLEAMTSIETIMPF